MAFKGAKKTFANKLGFKSSGSKAVGAELEKLKKEKAQLKMTLDEMSKQNGRHHPAHPDSDKAKLLERILSLRERNTQQLLTKEQEISIMRQQLQAEGGEVVASLQNQLDQKSVTMVPVKGLLGLNIIILLPVPVLVWREVCLSDYHDPGQSSASMQQEKQLQESQREMEEERKKASRLQVELVELKSKYEEKSSEVVRVQEKLQVERRSVRQTLAEERKLNTAGVPRLQCKIEAADVRLEEERKRAAELLLQANYLQKSLLTRHEDQKRMAVLEQQIQLSARDFENEKMDRQSLQHQLHKVLMELHKARDQITRLESAEIHFHHMIRLN
ncbi:centrosomal protein of 55 kDa-like [Ictalurus furcatus]|uniref:centrosomal protein of 55 kDa-like n=1 Tax=Ictalurus furcatus TaxID=66913 RepID=UPI00234FB88C|nr:centrosomal protein of 55 kDa-like [Ictalurus furcatus]